MWCGRPDSASRLSGTKVQPSPKPWANDGEDQRPRPHLQRKPGHLPQRGRGQQKPDQDEQRLSTLLIMRATMNIASIVPKPRGAIIQPASNTG